MANLRLEFFVLRVLWYLPFNELACLFQVKLTLVIFELTGKFLLVLVYVELCICLIGFNRIKMALTFTAPVAVKHSVMCSLVLLQELR